MPTSPRFSLRRKQTRRGPQTHEQSHWNYLKLVPSNCQYQPEDPESRPVPDAGVEVPDEEEPGDVAADDARRRELHRVREAVVPRQRVQQQTGVAVRHFTKRRYNGNPE